MPFVPKKQAFNAHINEVVLGVGDKATAIGGQNVLPFHTFDAEIKNAPKIGVELTDLGMAEYTMPGEKAFYAGCTTVAEMAKRAETLEGASFICLHLEGADPNGLNKSVEECVQLAKDVSEYDTLEAFKDSIRKNNQEQLDKQDDLAVENALVDQVIESMEAEIPQAMYDTRMDEMVNDFAFRVEQQGLRLEDYLKYMGQTIDQFRASFMPQAEKQVKIRLALEAVAAAENIEASEEDVSAEIKRIADQYKMEEDKVRELVNVDDLKKDLAINKAIDFIKSHANIVEKAAEAEKTEDAE